MTIMAPGGGLISKGYLRSRCACIGVSDIHSNQPAH